MPTYNVREDGTETTALNATGDISDPANAMTLDVLNAALTLNAFSDGDVIEISSRGGELISTVANNVAVSVDNITIQGESGYNPTIDLNSVSRIKVNNCSTSIIKDMVIHNNAANNCEWTGTGTGHVIRNVESYNAHTAAGAAAFTNELTAGTVHAYNCKGHDCIDDGWSAHAGSISYLSESCEFYNNSQGINGVSLSTIYDYGSYCHDNSLADLEMGSVATAAYFYGYKTIFDGAVISARANSTLVYMEFYGCKFNCNAVSSDVSVDDASVQFGNGNATRVVHSKFYGCETNGHPGAGKGQIMLRGGTGSTNEMSGCTLAQPTKTGYAVWDLILAADTSDYKNCNFYNATVGIHGGGTATQTTINCNYDACDAKYTVAPDTITNETTVDSGFTDAANSDFTLTSSSALVGAGYKWWTGVNPIGADGEPFSDFDTDLGAYQSLHSDYHPSNL
jgi:hypothetical protein